MPDIEFKFIGWCKEDNHDKVWGYFLRPTEVKQSVWGPYPTKDMGWNCCIFWGRRGKSMQFKADITGYDLSKIVCTKLNKGYDQISDIKLHEIWPTFNDEAKLKLTFEVLAGKVK